jgi:hypothetical protein
VAASIDATGIYGHADQSQSAASEMFCLEAIHEGLFKVGSEQPKKGEYVETHVIYYRDTKNRFT